MNKTELTIRISEKMGITQQRARHFLNVFEATLTEALQEDRSLMLQGFGTFELWDQTARMGRNPRTGEACLIDPRRSAKFRPGKHLLKQLNKVE